MENEGIPKDAIEVRAYELYLKCGCDGGHDLEHWLAAEEELKRERSERIRTETAKVAQRRSASSSAS